MAETRISREEFAQLLDRAGLDRLTPEQIEQLREGYRFIARVQRTIRQPRDRAAEPAHIFVHPRV